MFTLSWALWPDLRDFAGYLEEAEIDWLRRDFEGVALITLFSLRIFGSLRILGDCFGPEEIDLSPLPWLTMRLRACCTSYEGIFLAWALSARLCVCSLSARLGALSCWVMAGDYPYEC